ncbi:HPt (histidine-containing phosphotransfer) domain-containing protein [Rhodoligotrophos appendicifer]|uniref:Hpt domain-containing protein n=1 Tax=Rhodoligotrophos appendicifer TaxID=987056 RepID=UPI001187091E|nr:Hpt domain-containing protein [Rhodoligotrophos appendicifer]
MAEISDPSAGAPTPGIDLDHLQQYTLGDRSLEAEVLMLFSAALRDSLTFLGTTRDADQWRRTAHRLKGSALAVGAWSIADLASSMEGLAPLDEQARRYLTEIETCASTAQETIQRILAKLSKD